MDSLTRTAEARIHTTSGRMTNQRRVVLRLLEEHKGHPTAEELYEAARKDYPRLNLSTIYRILNWLEQEGLVAHRLFEEGRRMERYDALLPMQHYHFICKECNQVIEFDSPVATQIINHAGALEGAKIEATSIVVHGVCKDCR